MFEIENNRDLITNIAAEEFKSHRIRTFLSEIELDSTLKNLYRSAKVSMEENGSNTLFLALGLLRWFESDLSEKPRFAPIVLIPIDIVRNTRNKGYVIRSRQEEPQINITLLEYLRQDHGVNITGLDPLPLDEHGIDLPLVFNTVRQAVMGKARWNVEEYAFIGLFSFSRFVMWSDLRSRSEEIKQNKVVSSLIEGALTWTPEEINVTSENIDTEFDIANMAVPMSADSSQLTAIAAAGMGQSFVLHGPPGTGKSQTITNIIANALYNGKTVLFAAEKMAALNVVRKRLESIGLDPFCLELHSNKTNKSAVLGKLNRTLEVGRIKFPEEYAVEAEKLNNQRNSLNGIIDALHKKQKAGISPYEAISEFERNFSEYGKINFDKNTLADLTKEDISAKNELIGQYRMTISETGIFSDFPLKDIGVSAYSMELRDEFKKSAEALANKAILCKACADELKNAFGYGGAMDRAAVLMLKNIETALESEGDILPELLASAHYDTVIKRINELLKTGKEYSELRAQAEEKFESSVFNYNVEDAKLRHKQAESKWFLPKAMGLSKLVKELKLYAKDPSEITKVNLADIHETLHSIAEKKKTICDVPADIVAMLTGIFANEQTDWKMLADSANDLVSEVKIVHPDGFYDKGKSKQNKAEAKAIVDEIIRRLSDETLKNSSIGVVTFSSVQQNLIDDMLCEAWAKHPDLEDFDRKSDEPIFIKNLENVQGDERDVILFSVAYGPDKSGKISMNFGPLNRDGGWRRLNVAISRARKSMIVYSTLRPEQIDLSRTRSEGVAGLKGFLEFAEKGKLPVVSVAQGSEIENAVPDYLPAEIADAVSAMGYKVRCNIGCSEFKVDIGIVDPKNEKEYLLGILLDGRNNSRCSNSRDRFVLQPSVLNGLGWNIIRIWTLDWLDDRERVLRNIRTAIESISEKEEVKPSSKPLTFTNIQFEKEEPLTDAVTVAKPYINAPVIIRGNAEAFYLPKNKAIIKKTAEEIISVEAPISRKQLMKKVLNEWSITRSGSRVESIFIDAVSVISANKTMDGDKTFYWRNDQNPDKYEGYRIDDSESGKRSMDDIAPQEIINAVAEVLREQISLSETNLIRETAKKFGYSRMGGVIESSIEYAVRTGISKGKLIKSENGNIALLE